MHLFDLHAVQVRHTDNVTASTRTAQLPGMLIMSQQPDSIMEVLVSALVGILKMEGGEKTLADISGNRSTGTFLPLLVAVSERGFLFSAL